MTLLRLLAWWAVGMVTLAAFVLIAVGLTLIWLA